MTVDFSWAKNASYLTFTLSLQYCQKSCRNELKNMLMIIMRDERNPFITMRSTLLNLIISSPQFPLRFIYNHLIHSISTFTRNEKIQRAIRDTMGWSVGRKER